MLDNKLGIGLTLPSGVLGPLYGSCSPSLIAHSSKNSCREKHQINVRALTYSINDATDVYS